MTELTPDEARVVGVLIEKELTTPEQYPLTVNGVINGANQRNNRDPITTLDETAVRAALVGLRNKGLVVQLDGHGQRTSKFRHEFAAKVGVGKAEMVVLAELLLRGPQTMGELRGRASRMYPLESIDVIRNLLNQLAGRPEPLVRQLPPAPGSRAERFVQLLCPDLHPLEAPEVTANVGAVLGGTPGGPTVGATPTLAHRVADLEAEVAALRGALAKLAAELGLPDPLPPKAAPADPDADDSQDAPGEGGPA